MTMFFLIALSILGLLYGYTGWRLLAPLRLSLSWSLAVWFSLAILLFLPILAILLRNHSLPPRAHDALAWIAYLGLGLVVLTFSLLLVRDLFWLGLSAAERLLPFDSPIPTDPERRRFVLNTLNLGTVGLSVALTGYGIYAARLRLQIFEVSVPIADLPEELEGFRIVQFSDLHVGLTIKRDFVERTVDQIIALSPELIAFTGDLVDGELETLRSEVAPLARLSAPCGCYFVTGNHEYYNSDPAGWVEEVGRLGFTVLLNEHRLVERGRGRLLVAGVTDYSAGQMQRGHTTDPAAALAGGPPDAVRLLLAHQPRSIWKAAEIGCHLQLSGHTHGGQFIPWKYLIPLQQPFVAGLHRYARTWVYVNRGTGYWGPPLRLNVPAEITLLTLTRATAADQDSRS